MDPLTGCGVDGGGGGLWDADEEEEVDDEEDDDEVLKTRPLLRMGLLLCWDVSDKPLSESEVYILG